MNEKEIQAVIEKLKSSLMTDHYSLGKRQFLEQKQTSVLSSDPKYRKGSVIIDLNEVSEGGGLRDEASDTTTAAGLLTVGCYYTMGGDWYYTSTLYSGVSGNAYYYTTGVLNLVLLCNRVHLPISVIKEINIKFTGTNNSGYCVYANNGNDLVISTSSVNGVYTVPYKTVTDLYHSNEFSVSLADHGGFTTFSSSIVVEYVYEVSDILYANSTQTDIRKIDIHIPSEYTIGDTYPVMLTIHGGNWSAGNRSKTDFSAYTSHIHSKGFVHVSMDYRVNSSGLTYTCSDMLDDIYAVLNKLKNSYGDFIIQSKAALLGWSAGAHLALMFTYTRTSPIPIKLVISEAGPADIDCAYAEGGAAAAGWIPILEKLTGTPSSSSDFTDALIQISPAEQIPSSLPADVNTLIVYGTNGTTMPSTNIQWDGVVSVTHSAHLYAKLGSKGKARTMVHLTGINHNNILNYLPQNTSSAYYTEWSSATAAFMSI